jgi:hypothetical protein
MELSMIKEYCKIFGHLNEKGSDVGHLNEKGSDAFSKLLKKVLSQKKV